MWEVAEQRNADAGRRYVYLLLFYERYILARPNKEKVPQFER